MGVNFLLGRLNEYSKRLFSRESTGFSVNFSFFMSSAVFGGTVVFDFDPTSVTVVDEGNIYLFPNRVFEARFGLQDVGDSISVASSYKGFLVGKKQLGNKMATFKKSRFELRRIFYGDIVYYQKNQYFFLSRKKRKEHFVQTEKISPRDIKFSWVLPKSKKNRGIASLAKKNRNEKKIFAKKEGDLFRVRGKLLQSEAFGVSSIRVAEKIYYITGGKLNSFDPGSIVELSANKRQLLWVADMSL